jgi:hypothetical protein
MWASARNPSGFNWWADTNSDIASLYRLNWCDDSAQRNLRDIDDLLGLQEVEVVLDNPRGDVAVRQRHDGQLTQIVAAHTSEKWREPTSQALSLIV